MSSMNFNKPSYTTSNHQELSIGTRQSAIPKDRDQEPGKDVEGVGSISGDAALCQGQGGAKYQYGSWELF